MAEYTYYCEVKRPQTDYKAGVYKIIADGGFNRSWFPQLNRVITVSERVWKQGPRGGVKIIKDRCWGLYPVGYITTNEKYMEQFAWVKLQAQEIS